MSESPASPPTSRQPLRLRMVEARGLQPLDGGWWPQSRDLTVELGDLVDNFPAEFGRIVKVIISPPDWDDAPRRVPTRRGYVKVGFDAADDTHVLVLTTSERQELCVLVVPPDLSRAKGEEAMLGSVTPGYAASPTALLTAVRERSDLDDNDESSGEGEAWWGSDTPPTYRKAT